MSESVNRWVRILGANGVLSDDHSLLKYARSSSGYSTRPSAILFPSNVKDIQEILKTANQERIPVYPISRGKNWGYGDACAVTDGQVILDLSRMNRILEVNKELGYAVIEPGVTQKELYEYLENYRLPYLLDVTGAGPDASIVGNVLERGFGHTPYGDHYMHSTGYEVVLANGTSFTTGFGHYANSKSTYIYKHGVGPSLDGIFTQSGMGVVTKMGIWLLPKPERIAAFGFMTENPKAVGKIMEALRQVKMQGHVHSTVHVGNDLKILSSRMRYPEKLAKGRYPLPKELREKLRREGGIGAWNGLGGLYGTNESIRASKKALEKAFRGIAKIQMIDEKTLSLAVKLKPYFKQVTLSKPLAQKIESVESVFELLRGVPTDKHIESVAWRSKEVSAQGNFDPLDNEWGFLWLSPILPMTGDHTLRLLDLVEPVFQKYKFDALISFSALNSRTLCGVLSLPFNKKDEVDAASAKACYTELFEIISREGYFPYRVGIQSMQGIKSSDDFWKTADLIKKALDPNGILSPGRYS